MKTYLIRGVPMSTGFTGQAHAYGGRFAQSHPQNNGGAGTVYFRTADWPNGRLLLDNNGTVSAYGSTELPALGERSADAITGGAQISGTGFSEKLQPGNQRSA